MITFGGGTAGDLNFGDLATFNLRLFADLNQVPKLTEKLPFLKGSRLRLSVDNLGRMIKGYAQILMAMCS